MTNQLAPVIPAEPMGPRGALVTLSIIDSSNLQNHHFKYPYRKLSPAKTPSLLADHLRVGILHIALYKENGH